MSPLSPVEILVYLDDCDAFGHVNNAALLRMFERARWDALAAGPGADVFRRNGVAPVVRTVTVEYHRAAHPGDRLGFAGSLTHMGRTSFGLHQTVRRASDGAVIADADFVFVCLDADERPAPVPDAVRRFFGCRPGMRSGRLHRYPVGDVTVMAELTGDGPPILFIHGFPLDRTMWRRLVGYLPGRLRIAPDLRGVGLSDMPRDGYTMGAYADDLAALLLALDVERAVVCGLSMGGYVAFELLRRHPERISGLILANTRAEPDTAEGKRQRAELIALVEREGAGALAQRMLPRLLAARSLDALPEVVAHVRSMIADNPSVGLVGALSAMMERSDSTPLLGDIRVPTLVISGEEDQLLPLAHGEALAAAIPGARRTVIPEAGHLAPVERPAAVARAIAEFLWDVS